MGRIPLLIRIGIACIISFCFVFFIAPRYYSNSPEFNAGALHADVQKIIADISSFRFELPHFGLFSQRIEQPPEPSFKPEPTMAYETIPTEMPTSTPFIQPTSGISIIPTNRVVPTYAMPPTSAPTSLPNPTKPPKPTRGPDVFPIDASLKRPGETVDEIIAAAATKACAPKEVLRTLASIESGGFFDTVSPKYLLLYNSENWWNSEFITEEKRICSGYAYDGNTGIVFSDSKYAGYKCREGSGSGLGVVGVMSLSPYLYSHYKNDAAKVIGSKNVDRRIIFDSLVIAGMNIKENTKATTCTNWDARTVVKAACSYYGSCGTKDGTYYCATFCRNYQKYGGKDCSSAISQFTDTCWK